MSLNVFEPRYRLMIRRAMEGNRRFGMAQVGVDARVYGRARYRLMIRWHRIILRGRPLQLDISLDSLESQSEAFPIPSQQLLTANQPTNRHLNPSPPMDLGGRWPGSGGCLHRG